MANTNLFDVRTNIVQMDMAKTLFLLRQIASFFLKVVDLVEIYIFVEKLFLLFLLHYVIHFLLHQSLFYYLPSVATILIIFAILQCFDWHGESM